MVGMPMARRAPQRRAKGSALSLFAISYCIVPLLWPALASRLWLGPVGSSSPLDNGSENAVATLPSECETGRRQVWQKSAAAAASAFWAFSPEAAEAFRADRILNGKKSYVPTIRLAYQKLEGLRDDLYLDVELEQGNADSRVRFPARPADWFSGRDSSLDGPLVLVNDPTGFGCEEFTEKVDGVALIPRGRCPFEKKMRNAMNAGAKAVIVYDEKMSKQPLETQGKSGAVRSKGIATREPGDALYGGVSIIPVERGKTLMGVDKGEETPALDAAMISRTNGTDLVKLLKEGGQPRILDVKRFSFNDGIDAFIKKDLKKMLIEMEIYSNLQRVSKDDMQDPILKTLKKDREAFAAAVRSKDYGEFQRTFAEWNSHLDTLGKWDLKELF
mmetsp:Transcript_76669/g.211800  ORF Transcript_76669/g.211800 Transcript_76669/m.211800 type:complete len:388 (-) Transcript_76669:162-1325(-)